MNKKTAVITGATDGIGLKAAEGLLKANFFVIGTGRNAKKCIATENRLKNIYGDNIVYICADNSSLTEVKSLYRQICALLTEKGKNIDLLINNAGCYQSKKVITQEGFEKTEAVNYLSAFLLSHLFLPHLKKSAEGRIISVGSRSHYLTCVNCRKFNPPKPYFGFFAYRRSKLKLTMMTNEINKRHSSGNFHAYIADPGLVNTSIAQKSGGVLTAKFWEHHKNKGISTEQGADTVVFLANQKLRDIPYHYYYLRKPKKPSKFSLSDKKCSMLYQSTLNALKDYL